MSKPDMGSIFHIKKSMKYSGQVIGNYNVNYKNYQNLMLLTSSDTKRTLMPLILFTNSAQRKLVSEYTQLQFIFLALVPWSKESMRKKTADLQTLIGRKQMCVASDWSDHEIHEKELDKSVWLQKLGVNSFSIEIKNAQIPSLYSTKWSL